MTMHKKILASALAFSVAGLAACSGDSVGSQDVPNNDDGPQSRAFYARAVDGYLAGATAYIDLNEDGRLDAFEPRAITDSDGFFSYNHLTDTDYCAAGASSQHCLRGAIAADAEVMLRVAGGYDTVTGLPFKGTLSLRSSELNRDDLRLVTPQTSLVADLDATMQAKLDALIDAGILDPGGSFDDDHIGDLRSASATRAQLMTTLVRAFGQAADLASTTSMFEDVDSEAWYTGYVAMAASMIEGVQFGDFSTSFSDVDTSWEAVRQLAYSQLGLGSAVPDSFTLPNELAANSLLQFSSELVSFNEELIAAMQGNNATDDQLKAALRVLAVASERGLKNPTDPEVTDLFAWARNQLAQGNGLGSDLTGLGGDNIDLSTLIDPAFNFDPASNSVSASAAIPAEAANAFASLVNTSFGVRVNKLDEQGAALIFIGGTSGARSGDLDICVRYRDLDGDFDTGSSTDPNGAMLVTGSWSLLNDHSLTLSVDVVGGVRPLLLKSVGVNGTERQYRFDFGGDLSEWSGSAPAGFATGAVPTSDATCRTALIERFGSAN